MFFFRYMKEPEINNSTLPDWTDTDEVRRAIIVSEILNRKY